MTMTSGQALILIFLIALMTLFTRALPFLLFPQGKETPAFVRYLGKVLPCAVMGMLIIYCLKGVSVFSAPYGAPELISVAAVILLHKWKHSTLLSIGGGTLLYMFFIQFVFI
ncbi:branched-chain amino acid transporter permease [Caproiciproducens faecalis]|uniref:Branched-chain amino acid transporter permease n=1 Tax=Caproiciproducens faecalis TaxID=2820301 RepID=A0ABS7DKN5_9FIRM|nr:branched-chain amino acid transporter permease [Caproiciproducens faecalis]MBW7571656.1 branched-chain amino acid transporter permease [Caproiciproducens faecalis]